MPYKRRADKHTDTPITPQMIALFDKLRRARSEQQYDDLHGELWGAYQAELRARTGRTRPWEWPICVDPRYDENPYPHGTWPHANWQPNERARAMWRQLEQASREARAARAARTVSCDGAGGSEQPAA